jgi:NADH-quinone oxidoreductase subunit N
VLFTAFDGYQTDWRPAIWAIAILTLLLGSIVALVQTDIKRMLAYSSISHAGYILIGVQAGTVKGVASALFYLLTYTFMVVGSFAVVTVVGRKGDRRHSLDDYRGLGSRAPLLAGAMTFLLLGQAGIPLTSGFVAKFAVFAASVDAKEYGLTLVGVITTVIAAFFYLRVIVLMYMSGDTEPAPAEAADTRPFDLDPATGVALGLAVAATVVMGIIPGGFLNFAESAKLLF